MAKYEHVEIFTPPFRVCFTNLVDPDTFDKDKPAYNLRALWAKTVDMAWFNNAVAECARLNGFISPDNQYTVRTIPTIGDGDTCFNQDTKEAYEGHPGHHFFKFTSSNSKTGPMPMDICDQQGAPVEAKDIYSGCWVRALIRVCVFDNPDPRIGKGLMVRCDNLEFLGHDEPFSAGGGRVSSAKAFGGNAVQGLPAHVTQTAAAPQAAAPGPQSAPAPVAQQQQVAPPPAAAQLSPGDYQNEFAGDTAAAAPPPPAAAAAPPPPVATGPTMGPNAKGVAYETYIAGGWSDDQMRAGGIII